MSEIDTGDIVLHRPTGENWVVARVDGNKLSWLGWPPGWGDLDDCVLVKKASNGERHSHLASLAKSGHHCAAWAAERLLQESTS